MYQQVYFEDIVILSTNLLDSFLTIQVNLNILEWQGGPGSPLSPQKYRRSVGGAEAVIYPRYCRVLANIFSPGYGRT